jgi:molybdopterin biosynthesis enzyme MoaB
MNTMSELTTLQTNIVSVKANVDHIELHSKDNDRSKKIVKKALRNKGTQTFIKEKNIINENETKIKQIIDAL